MSQTLIEYFSSLPGLSRLPAPELAELASTCEERSFERGKVLFTEGSPGSEMFLLKAGAVHVVKHFRGKEQVLATLHAGDILGDMSLVDGQPHVAECRAVQHTMAVVLPRAAFERLKRERPSAAIQLMEYLAHTLCERIRRANRTLALFHVGD